ncbi:hypothetical protein ACFLXY_08120 [Chloroflexota bacterium]
MDKDLLLVIISGGLVGFYANAGSVVTYFLNERTQKYNRRREYTREALKSAKQYANFMEMDVKNIIFTLTGLNIGLANRDKKQLKKSMDNIRRYLMDNTWIPEVNDKNVGDAWQKVSQDFMQMHLVFAENSEYLSKRTYVKQMSPSEIANIREILNSDDPDKIKNWIAPDPATQEVFESAISLLASIQAFRKQIELASTD